MLFSDLNVHIFKSSFVEGKLMSKGEGMWDFSSEEFESVVPVGLEDMEALLVNILSTLVTKIICIDLILTLQEGLSFFPVMHGIDKYSFEFVNGVIEPENISKVILVDSSKVDFVVKVVSCFYNVEELLRDFVVVF
jgi:hypothetical protein